MSAALSTRGLFHTIVQKAFEPRDVASLVFFRLAFGTILLWEAVRYLLNGWIESLYLAPKFHFTYLGFGWIKPWPGEWLYLQFLVLAIAALFVALGLFYRTSTAVLCLGWTYTLLLEKSAFLNHLYLICLLAFLLTLIPTHCAFSMDARRWPERHSSTLPAWCLWVLRAQIAIPYVFGAIAKLNGDWLRGQPLQMWVFRMPHLRSMTPLFGADGLGLFLSWGGFLLDLLIVPLLLYRATRLWAFLVAVGFHVTNSILFRIGIFPWFMICATMLFFDPDWPRRLFHQWEHQQGSLSDSQKTFKACPRVLFFFALWFLIQLTVPFHHFLYRGDVDWTAEGSRFTWRMMLCDKAAALRFFCIDPQTKAIQVVDPRQYLTATQLNYLGQEPDLLVQFSQFIANEHRLTTGADIEVHAQAICSLNGRKPQLLMDPSIDLAKLSRGFRSQSGIIPLTEPLSSQPWDQPPSTWSQHIDFSKLTGIQESQRLDSQ